MWTANIKEVQKRETTIDLLVEFLKDGVFHSNFVFKNADLATIQTPVRNRINELQAIDTIDTKAALGAIDLTVTPLPIPLPLTQAEIDKRNYFALLEKWMAAKLDVDNGLLSASGLLFSKLDADLKTAYKPAYSGL